jgi:hypothetical protein
MYYCGTVCRFLRPETPRYELASTKFMLLLHFTDWLAGSLARVLKDSEHGTNAAVPS